MTDLPLSCPHCTRTLDKVAQFADGSSIEPPQDGDVRVCIECGEPSFYALAADGALTLRSPTAEELAELYAMAQMQAIRAAMRQQGPTVRIVELPQ